MKFFLACLLLMGALLLPARAGMTGAQEKEILEAHNAKREGLNLGTSVEPDLKWNSKLAEVGQAYSAKCIWGHNGARQTEVGKSGYVGENLFITTGKADMTRVVSSWYSEVENYHMDSLSCDAGKMCGHYTQVVWSKTTEVGCGMTKCSTVTGLPYKDATLVVCDYWPGGNYRGQAPFPTARKSKLEVLLQMLMDEEQEQAVIEMNGDDISVESDSETDEAVRFMSTLNYDDDNKCVRYVCYGGEECCGGKECKPQSYLCQ